MQLVTCLGKDENAVFSKHLFFFLVLTLFKSSISRLTGWMLRKLEIMVT